MDPFSLVSGTISGIADIFGASSQAAAANKAAAAEQQGATSANQIESGVTYSQILPELNQTLGSQLSVQNPYVDQGAQSLGDLSTLLQGGGVGGGASVTQGYQGQLNLPTAPNLPQFTAPNPADVLNNPAIQFQLQQGELATQQAAAAGGTLNSGQTLKNLDTYAQGVASQGYNNLFNQAQQTWQNQTQTAQQGFQNQYQNAVQAFNSGFGVYQNATNNTLGLVNQGLQSGQSAANTTTNVLGSNTAEATSALQGNAQATAGNTMGAANAAAAGYVGSANAVNQGLTNVGNTALTLGALNQYNQGGAGGNMYQPAPTSATDNFGNPVYYGPQYTG